MSSTKNTKVVAITGKIEGSYNAGASASLHGPDSIQPESQIELSPEYAFDGARGISPGTFGPTRRVGPSGRIANFSIPIEAKGAGTAYTASSDTVPNMQNLFLASGISASMNANSWSFKPIPENVVPQSIALNIYHKGEVRPVSGAYASFTWGSDSAAPPIFDFALQGTTALPVDVTLPAITYEADSVLPPKSENIRLVVNFGGAVSTLKVRSYNFDQGLGISPRLDLNVSAGHAGFARDKHESKYVVVVEAEALTTFNPESLWSAGTNGSINTIVGATDGNITELNMPQAQITNVTHGEDGSVATWEIEFTGYTSTSTAADDFEFLLY